MKAILIMDMPETCMDCKVWSLYAVNRQTHYFCKMLGRKQDLESPNTARDPRCPLVPARGYVTPEGHLVSWEDDSDGKD